MTSMARISFMPDHTTRYIYLGAFTLRGTYHILILVYRTYAGAFTKVSFWYEYGTYWGRTAKIVKGTDLTEIPTEWMSAP